MDLYLFLENYLLLLDCSIAVMILLVNIINDNNKVLEVPISQKKSLTVHCANAKTVHVVKTIYMF